MILGIILCAYSLHVFLIHLIGILFKWPFSEEILSLFVGFVLLGTLASIASIVLNITSLQNGKLLKGSIGLTCSIAALALSIGYIIFRLVLKSIALGYVFF